jgi:predicted metal-binding protein
MTLHITYCLNCAQDAPTFLHTVSQLQQDHPDDLCVVGVPCMAACDDAPAITLESDQAPYAFDYCPCMTAPELERFIRRQLVAHEPAPVN